MNIHIFFVLLLLFNITNVFSQNDKSKYLNDFILIGEQKIDSPYIVTFLPTFESIIIMKDEISLIKNDTCFSTAILKTGSVYFLTSRFYSSFLFLKYNIDYLSNRVDSALFTKYYKLIADEVNLNESSYIFGPLIINNNHMKVYQIYEDRFLVGIANIQSLNKYLGYESTNYSIPGINNIFVKFMVPLRKILKEN